MSRHREYERRLWGMQHEVSLASGRVRILELPLVEFEDDEREGQMLGVVAGITLIGLQASGILRVVGVASWQAGGGRGSVEFDVAAGGGAIAVPASEAITLEAYAEGTSASRYMVSGAVAAVRAPFPRPPIRSRLDPHPGGVHPIPGFARQVTFSSDTPAAFGGVTVELLSNDPASGPPVVLSNQVASTGPYLVPGGSTHFRFSGGAAQNINSIWELCL